ncbi:MAG TPA: DMT family transporter [Methylomirabilota bacterium]|nr:DMT family transporter [Methylomirabilota bacterium]
MRSAAGAAAVALLLVILLWASNSIMVKIVLREIDPLTLTWLRFVIAGLFYVPYAVLTRAEAPRYTGREGMMLLAAGIALVPVFSLTLYWALSYTTVANTALVRMTEPAWVLLLGALLLGERATSRQLGGFALALLGTLALVLLGQPPSGGGEHHVLGMMYMGANSFAWVGYVLCFKHLLRRHSVTQLTTHAALVGSAALFLVTGWTHASTVARQALAMSALAWVLVIAMALLVTIASNQLFAYGLQRVPAGVATAYSYLIPVFAAAGAWLFLGEPITNAVVVCGAVIAVGVYLINRD